MIMQPPAYRPKKGFPRRTFGGLAGTTIALGLALMFVAVGEIIYSVKIVRKCESVWEYRHDYMRDDIEYPQEREHWREKRSHHRGYPGRRDWDSSSEESDFFGLRKVMEDVSMEERCEVFSAVAGFAATTCAACSVVFIVTGALGVAAARTMVAHRQSGLKTGFIVMNILNILGFAPLVFMIGTAISKAAPAVIQKDDYYKGHVITGYMTAFIGMVLSVIALVSACISCCFAPTEEHVKVVAMPAAPFKLAAPAVQAPIQLQVDEKAQLVENEATQA